VAALRLLDKSELENALSVFFKENEEAGLSVFTAARKDEHLKAYNKKVFYNIELKVG